MYWQRQNQLLVTHLVAGVDKAGLLAEVPIAVSADDQQVPLQEGGCVAVALLWWPCHIIFHRGCCFSCCCSFLRGGSLSGCNGCRPGPHIAPHLLRRSPVVPLRPLAMRTVSKSAQERSTGWLNRSRRQSLPSPICNTCSGVRLRFFLCSIDDAEILLQEIQTRALQPAFHYSSQVGNMDLVDTCNLMLCRVQCKLEVMQTLPRDGDGWGGGGGGGNAFNSGSEHAESPNSCLSEQALKADGPP